MASRGRRGRGRGASGPSQAPTTTPPLTAASRGRGRGRGGTKRGPSGDVRSVDVPISASAPRQGAPLLRGAASIILRGAFSSITGLTFQGQNIPKGRDLIPNLMNPEEEQIPGEDTVTIRGRIIRETNINDPPWCITLVVRVSDRRVVKAQCSCYVGTLAQCKHVAALYLFINEERSEGKTDDQQQWKTPSEKIRAQFPKGETVGQIYGATESSSVRQVRVQGNDDLTEVKPVQCLSTVRPD